MSFGILHVAPAVAAFAREYPEVQVDAVLDDRFVDLVEQGFDLAIRIGNLADSALVAHRLGRNRNVLVAHAEYLKKAGTPKAPRDLAAHDTLIYSLSVASAEWTLHQGRRTERVKVKPRLQANSSLALREAALGGLGIARIPLFAVGADLRSRRLRRVLPDWELPEHGIFALTTSRLQQPRKTRAFIDFLHERTGDPPYWEVGTD